MPFKRLFVALAIPEELRKDLSAYKNFIHLPGLSWVKEENLHITLLFLGNVDVEKIPVVEQKLSTLITLQPFIMYSKELVPVTRRGKLNMIWVGFEENPLFVQLADHIAKVLNHSPDHSPLPHVTLARVKKGQNIKIGNVIFPSIANFTWQVQKFELWESVLTPQGSVYTVLNKWELKGIQ